MVWLTRSLARAHPLAHEACARAHTQVPAGDLGHFIEGRSEPEPLAHADGADAEPVRPLLLKGGIATLRAWAAARARNHSLTQGGFERASSGHPMGV